MNLQQGWANLLFFPEGTAAPFVFLASFAFFFVFGLGPVLSLARFFERKMTGDLQARVGPNRAGTYGWLQEAADVVKLFSKQGPHSAFSNGELFMLCVEAGVVSVFFVLLPWGMKMSYSDSEVGVFLPFVFILLVEAIRLHRLWEYRNFLQIISPLRKYFLTQTAIIPAFFSALSVAIIYRTANITEIASAQAGGFLHWSIVRYPQLIPSFFTLLISSHMILRLPPFEESSVYEREDSGMGRLMRIFFSEALNAFWFAYVVALFFGAWGLPFLSSEGDGAFGAALDLYVTLFKACGLLILSKVVARALPEIRLEIANEIIWKLLMPVSVILLALNLFVSWGGLG